MGLEAVFFVLPFFLFSGVALQAVGLYLCALVIPAVLWAKGTLRTFDATCETTCETTGKTIGTSRASGAHAESSGAATRSEFPFLRLGVCFAVAFCAFPLANLATAIWPHVWSPPLPESQAAKLAESLSKLTLKKFFESRLSSSVAIGAGTLIFLGVMARRRVRQNVGSWQPVSAQKIFRAFVLGCAFATAVYGCYFIFQCVTGFDYRSAGHLLLPEHRMSNGFYRIFGFFGHPLSLASVCLAFFVFFWSLFWQLLKASYQDFHSHQPPLNELLGASTQGLPAAFATLKNTTRRLAWIALFIAMAHLFFVVASGGRMALVVALLGFATVPWSVPLAGRVRLLRVISSVGGACVVGFSVWWAGLGARFAEFLTAFTQGVAADRATFWAVHWQMFLDHPFFGQGPAYLDRGMREAYYVQLGFAGLRDKFNAHNLFLETLASSGLIGFVLLAGAVFVAIRIFRAATQKCSAVVVLVAAHVESFHGDVHVAKVFAGSFAMSMFANLVHGLTQNTFFDSNVSLVAQAFLWVLVWLCVAQFALPKGGIKPATPEP